MHKYDPNIRVETVQHTTKRLSKYMKLPYSLHYCKELFISIWGNLLEALIFHHNHLWARMFGKKHLGVSICQLNNHNICMLQLFK